MMSVGVTKKRLRMESVLNTTSLSWEAMNTHLSYLNGFGAELQSEAIVGTIPIGQNNPQKCPYNLYAEQLSGTSFTTPRANNRRSWLYRIQPSVTHSPFDVFNGCSLWLSDFSNAIIDANPLRWKPFPEAAVDQKIDFVDGIKTVCGSGSVEAKTGLAIHIFAANSSMIHKAFMNSDGDLLIVPQLGDLAVQTEFGLMLVKPGDICVVQRGMRFSVRVNGSVRGYICEVFDGHLSLPELGPIGANGLANARDFQHPRAYFDKPGTAQEWQIIHKLGGKFFTAFQDHSVFDVVGWTGNYSPYKYELDKFCAMNSVTFDHPDPSIFTVLTVPSGSPGVAALDLVIFPPRWQVQEHTFRPPYFHRNVMSEFMGNIRGQYEAKASGFVPGSATLHTCCTPHGPDAEAFDKHSQSQEIPVKLENSLAFMFESTYILRLSPWAAQRELQDIDYWQCWQPLKANFIAPTQI